MDVRDFIVALRAELEGVKGDLDTWMAAICAAAEGDAQFMESLEAYSNQVQRLGDTSEMMGLYGLRAICGLVQDGLLAMGGMDAESRAAAKPVFDAWPERALVYLNNTSDFEAAEKLLTLFTEPPFPAPVDVERGMQLMTLLTEEPTLAAELRKEAEAEEASRQTEATEADVSLALPEDVDHGVYEALMQEAPTQASDFSALIQKMIDGEAQDEDLATAKRIAHSFKGSANIVGIRGIASLGHHTEDILEYFEQHKTRPPAALANTLLDAAACLEQMVGYLLGIEEEPTQALTVLQAVLNWSNRIHSGHLEEDEVPGNTLEQASVALDQMATETSTAEGEQGAASITASGDIETSYQVSVGADTAVAGAPQAPADAPNRRAADRAGAEQMMRVPVKTVDELFRLTGELSVKIGQLTEQVKQAQQRSGGLLRQNLQVQQRIFELENLVDIRGLAGLRNARVVSGTQDFDALEMDQYTELHSNTRALMEETADAREMGLRIEEDIAQMTAALQQAQRVQREMQYMTMTTRMTPVGGITSRLHRNVRQTAQQTNKKAKLVIEGEDILIDGDMLNKLADPLLHILRNAVDHGVETPEERARLGKPEVATIHLLFARRGQTVMVRCRDDGKGLDYAAIREKAIERGLMQAGQDATEEELSRLILLPGFSTRAVANEISGRGVGMDVVRDRLLSMKGSVEVRSEFGKGCEVQLRFQASLVAQHALLVRAVEQVFAVPSYALDQALPPAAGEFVDIGGEPNLRYQRNIYPVRALETLLGYGGVALTNEQMLARSILLVRADQEVHAVLVDRIVDGRDLILKDTGKYVKNIKGVGGVAILGDGTVAPLLDLAELLRQPVTQMIAASQGGAQDSSRMARRGVLVVDDSMSVRKSLTQLVEDAGYEVRAAKDGMEAINMLDQFQPGIVLTDLEMPNMNGLELTAHLRARPQTKGLPVVMITSRSMDKHRRQAEMAGVNVYLTKPYTDTDLLAHIREAFAAAPAGATLQ